MASTAHPLLQLTASDLMNRNVRTLVATLTVREAAWELARWGLRGMPVVDSDGHLCGMLSITDLARWVAQRNQQEGHRPKACAFQHIERYPSGREEVRCLLPAGTCPFQRLHLRSDGQQVLLCGDPQSVPTDWQMVESQPQPLLVRDVMTTVVHTVPPETTLPQLARRMLEEGVHRLLVVDASGHLAGIVAADDLLQVLARLDDPHFSPPSS